MGYSPDHYDAEADFHATGSIICDDCGTRVHTASLITLPDHGCVRERRRQEQIRALDAGQPSAAREFPRGC